MKIAKKPNGYWTKERCEEEATKYKSRKSFQLGCISAYNKSRQIGCLDEICNHMQEIRKPNNYWTKERCLEEALKYNKRREFQKKSGSAYNTCLKNNWLDDACGHMNLIQKPSGYWTKEKCLEEALKYNKRSDFSKNSVRAYNVSRKNGWLDGFCKHMEVIGNRMFRCIYAITFEDNNVYIGLTYSIKDRFSKHISHEKSSVFKHIEKTKLEPVINQLTDYIPIELAKIKEGEFVKRYKEEGWIILNKVKTGGIGFGKIIWTKEKCHEEALKYKTNKEYREKSTSYGSACKNGWIKEIITHMKELRKPDNYWTKEKCHEEALKYDSKTEFHRNSSASYNVCYNNGWLDEICSHMKEIIKSSNYWTKERCKEEALKYNSKIEFRRKSGSAYGKSLEMKWIDEICCHMKEFYKPVDYWTKEKCLEEALKYDKKTDFKSKSSGAYNKAYRNKWINEICKHMKEFIKPNYYWTKERCLEQALIYKTKSDLKNSCGSAYNAARRNKWLDEIFEIIKETNQISPIISKLSDKSP